MLFTCTLQDLSRSLTDLSNGPNLDLLALFSQVPKADKFALGIITYVGCILSLFGAVGAITSFAVFT